MCAEVSVKAALNRKPVVVRALLANNCFNTQISRRLAKKLGLNSVQDAFVAESVQIMGGDPICVKWKVSLQPILITIKVLNDYKTRVVYPIINYNENDAFWEMIIGQDCCKQWELMNAAQTVDWGAEPTPGPGWKENTHFLGHNLRLIANSSCFRSPPNEFLEYLCFDSEAIKRIAINKATKQLCVVFHDSTTVYMYDGVSTRIFDRIDAGESKGQVVSEVKQTCGFSTIQNFPRTVLLTDGKF